MVSQAANQGDIIAKNMLQFMYEQGHGAPQDYAEAAKWYRGCRPGRPKLHVQSRGAVRSQGQDYVRAHMWFNLSAAQGYETAANDRQHRTAHDPSADAEAQKLAREWKPTTQPTRSPIEPSICQNGLREMMTLSCARRAASVEQDSGCGRIGGGQACFFPFPSCARVPSPAIRISLAACSHRAEKDG